MGRLKGGLFGSDLCRGMMDRMADNDLIGGGAREIAELQTRFLFPIRVPAECGDVGTLLAKLTYRGVAVWERQDKLGEAYLTDLAREAREILQGGSAALEYFTVKGTGCADAWFGREWQVFFQPKGRQADLRAKRGRRRHPAICISRAAVGDSVDYVASFSGGCHRETAVFRGSKEHHL